jgi:hypothetical protein
MTKIFLLQVYTTRKSVLQTVPSQGVSKKCFFTVQLILFDNFELGGFILCLWPPQTHLLIVTYTGDDVILTWFIKKTSSSDELDI